MPEIILQHVTKRFDKFVAVQDLDLQIQDRGFITLLGPSGRAVKVLAASYLPEDEVRGVKAVLSAAALTYVAAALQAVLQLLRLILISGNSRRRD